MLFQAALSQNSDSESCHKGVGRRYVCRIHPFGHHFKAGEVLLQGFQLADVAAEDDARSGNHRPPTPVLFMHIHMIKYHHPASLQAPEGIKSIKINKIINQLPSFICQQIFIFYSCLPQRSMNLRKTEILFFFFLYLRFTVIY